MALAVRIVRRSARPELEKAQIVLSKPIDFAGDDMVAEKCQRRFFAFVPFDPPLEFRAVSGPGAEKGDFALFILWQASDSLEPDAFRLALARSSAMVRNPRVQVLDQFVCRQFDPKSINHAPPPLPRHGASESPVENAPVFH
jgi:hypothetical protein